MRPTAHARRLSSPAASSRHAVDAVVVGNPVPLGIPALFDLLPPLLSSVECRVQELLGTGAP